MKKLFILFVLVSPICFMGATQHVIVDNAYSTLPGGRRYERSSQAQVDMRPFGSAWPGFVGH